MVETKKSIAGVIAIMMVLPWLCFAASTTLKIALQVGTGTGSILPQKSVTTFDGMEAKVSMAGRSQMQVEVNYQLMQQDLVKLKVYNTNGAMVKELVNAAQGAGLYHAVWNGSDKSGAKVSRGVYLMVLDRGSQRITKMATLIK